jgi:hypothetical protein
MFERAEKWCTHAGAGHWPDADMLPIGPLRQCYDTSNWTNFTKDEQITMMTLWSILRSPLIIGGEMTGFDDFTLNLVTNREILAMHSEARHSHQVWRRVINQQEWVLWTAVNPSGGTYAAIFNLSDTDGSIQITLDDLELKGPKSATELWSGAHTEAKDGIETEVPAHGAKVFLL